MANGAKSGAGGPLDRERAILEWLPDGPVLGAEIGVHCGVLSARLLHRPGLHLYLVDSWAPFDWTRGAPANFSNIPFSDQIDQDRFRVRALKAVAFADGRFHLLHAASEQAANMVANRSLDFVFIDADHSYEGCSSDIHHWRPKVKAGGFISGHDHHWPGVRKAVDEIFGRVDIGADNVWRVRL
jgi:hypothetical protein